MSNGSLVLTLIFLTTLFSLGMCNQWTQFYKDNKDKDKNGNDRSVIGDDVGRIKLF